MALVTGKEYTERLKKMKSNVYAFGQKVDNFMEHPCMSPTINAVAKSYDLEHDPSFRDLMLVNSNLTGRVCSNFTHVYQSTEELLQRARMMRACTLRHGGCVGARCVGSDGLNALHVVTYDMDQKLGTNYHERFLEFLKYVQENDLACSGAVTDAKADRSLKPSQQADPDSYVRVVEKRNDGIVVRGAKAHISGALFSDEIVVLPTENMGPDDKDYAVAFATPSDTEGIIHIFESPSGTARRLLCSDEDTGIDLGNPQYGVHGATMVVFDDVFVPNERVFMCGEHEFSPSLVEIFARFHRFIFAGCKSGHLDLLLGALMLFSEYNGTEKISHVREKFTDLAYMTNTAFGCALGAATQGYKTPSGSYAPDMVLSNCAKLHAVEAVVKGTILGWDLCGGILCTVPSEADMKHPEIGKYVKKYFKGVEKYPTEYRIRAARLVEYLTGISSVIPPEAFAGGGPIATQRIMIRFGINAKVLKQFAKEMAGIPAEDEAKG